MGGQERCEAWGRGLGADQGGCERAPTPACAALEGLRRPGRPPTEAPKGLGLAAPGAPSQPWVRLRRPACLNGATPVHACPPPPTPPKKKNLPLTSMPALAEKVVTAPGMGPGEAHCSTTVPLALHSALHASHPFICSAGSRVASRLRRKFWCGQTDCQHKQASSGVRALSPGT